MSSSDARIREKLVDDFVSYLNSQGFEERNADEVPPEFRKRKTEDGWFEWQIQYASPNPWIQELALRLPKKFPEAYRYFIENYRFCIFEVGPIMFLANTGQDTLFDLSVRSFSDEGLYPTLHKNGLLAFGNPFQYNYDPVCFDMKRENRCDAPIVQLDHEAILIRERVRVIKEIAPSFSEFMEKAITEKFAVT